jgi:hypothetical protein
MSLGRQIKAHNCQDVQLENEYVEVAKQALI